MDCAAIVQQGSEHGANGSVRARGLSAAKLPRQVRGQVQPKLRHWAMRRGCLLGRRWPHWAILCSGLFGICQQRFASERTIGMAEFPVVNALAFKDVAARLA